MQQQFFQVFRLAFNLIKAVIYIVFTITLGSDLSHVHSLIETGIVLGAVLAALAFCSNPTLETGVRACVTTAGETAFDAITDVIHRLLALLPKHSLPKVIQT